MAFFNGFLAEYPTLLTGRTDVLECERPFEPCLRGALKWPSPRSPSLSLRLHATARRSRLPECRRASIPPTRRVGSPGRWRFGPTRKRRAGPLAGRACRSSADGANASGRLLLRLAVAARERRERRGESRELGRDDELRGRRRAELTQCVEVLQRDGASVGVARHLVDLVESESEPLGAQDLRLPLPLGLQDVGLLIAFSDEDGGGALALGLRDRGTTSPLGSQLTVHGLLHVARRCELADLDRRDLHAPALRHLVELCAQDLVDLLAFCEHVVQEDVADDRAQRRRRDARHGGAEVLDLQHRVGGLLLDHLLVDEEVDRDRCVVLGDAGLLRDLDDELTQIDVDADLDGWRE